MINIGAFGRLQRVSWVDRRNDWLGQFGRGEELTIQKYEETKNLITRETSLPVYRLDPEDSIERLCDEIIDFFNKE